MAMIQCAECGREISDKAAACIHCGCPMGESVAVPDSALTSINGVAVDLRDIVTTYGRDKIAAIKHLRGLTPLSLAEAKKIVDEAYTKFGEKPSGFWATAIEQGRQQALEKQANKPISKKERIKENKANAVACCPKCGSTSLTASKKGFGIGKAVVGAALTGGIGLAAGNIGAKKVRVTCLNCGKQCWAGQK